MTGAKSIVVLTLWVFPVLAGSVAPQADRSLASHERQLNGHTFTLPAGFEIELVAGPPLVDRPISAAFDESGRLYVTDSSGSNDKVDKQLAEKPHRVVRLEDSDGDGRFDKSTVFADAMMFPEGSMWFDGSLYVAAPPSIWKLTDTDGDGVADQREEWFQGKTLTGCANDLHGPYLGPDGWIYWCKGAFARQTYERVGKSLRVIDRLPLDILGKPQPANAPDLGIPDGMDTWSTRASHIFRSKPDGSGLEVVMTGGMDNPVDVVFTAGGERLFTTTFFQHPGSGLRDGLIHAVYGGIYGKDHDPIHEPAHRWTGPGTMPVLAHQGAAAPCGLEIYQSQVFGADYRGNLFACLFNMHKVTRHVLEPDGATFRSRDEDFLISSNLDFHPTDVLEDADGSLLVVDTGGWYKLCCPTSQLQKPDILGAIYRVRRADAPRIDDPRGRELDWGKMWPNDLTRLLGDARTAVRSRAIDELAKRAGDAIEALAESVRGTNLVPVAGSNEHGLGAGSHVRLGAIWTLTRIDCDGARAAVRAGLGDDDEDVRQAAIHSISLWRDRGALSQLVQMLDSDSLANRRAAAEALGRLGDPAAVPALVSATAQVPAISSERSAESVRVLEHSLIYALIEIGDPIATSAGLKSFDPRMRRATLIALSEMSNGGLQADVVAPLISSPDPVLKEAATWIVSRHADWGTALAGYLRQRVTEAESSRADRLELAGLLARFARTPAIQELLAASLMGASEKSSVRRVALEAMRLSGLKEKELPRTWIAAVAGVLTDESSGLVPQAIATARSFPMVKEDAGELTSALLGIGRRSDMPSNVRIDALAAIPGGLASVDSELFDMLRAHLSPESEVVVRSAAADVLAKAKLTPDQLASLADSLKTVGPLEVDRLLTPFGQCSDEAVGLKLVSTLKGSPALGALRADSLRTHLAKFGPPVQEQVQQLYAAINVDVAKQKERLDELLASLSGGDVEPGNVRRGQAVFMSQKAACSSCHQFGYLGGKVGPDLTRIGGIRDERDLLESIAFPSVSFVRSYETLLVATKDGRAVSGVVRKDAPSEIVLATNATEEVRIGRDEIDEIRPGTVSVMPSGLDQQLTRQEVADLIAFLKAAK